jgi:hypothetical protein
MLPTFSARAHFGKVAIDLAYITHAAQQVGGLGTLSADGFVEGSAFATMKNVEQFCARVCVKYPNLKFEISRPRLRKKKGEG